MVTIDLRLTRLLVALGLFPLLLAGCLFLPGKFESALVIHADRSFTYSYKGEVLAIDVSALMGKAVAAGIEASAKGDKNKPGKTPDLALTPDEKAKQDAQFREIAAQVAKESGYHTVEYRGDGVFYVDYSISGKLTHNFVFPYNQDAQMIFPFLAIELRGKDQLRVKAPGFAQQGGRSTPGMSGMGTPDTSASIGKALGLGSGKTIDGVFTLTTDAEIVSQNNEDGAVAGPAGRTIRWHVTPRTTDAPMAMLRVAPM